MTRTRPGHPMNDSTPTALPGAVDPLACKGNPGTVYREGLASGTLKFLRCVDCQAAQTLPRYACRCCGSTRLHWGDSKRNGVVYALTAVTRAPSDAFRALAPYTLVLVDLDEGFRAMGHGTPDLAIGDTVHANVESIGGAPLLVFRRASGA